MIRIEFFGSLSDLSGPIEMMLPPDVTDTEGLAAWLGRNDERLSEGLTKPQIRAVVNDRLRPGPAKVEEGDLVSFMSPVGGG